MKREQKCRKRRVSKKGKENFGEPKREERKTETSENIEDIKREERRKTAK